MSKELALGIGGLGLAVSFFFFQMKVKRMPLWTALVGYTVGAGLVFWAVAVALRLSPPQIIGVVVLAIIIEGWITMLLSGKKQEARKSDKSNPRQEAASEFNRILRKVHDSMHSPYTDEACEVCEYTVKRLPSIEKELGEYLNKHGIVLPSNLLDRIEEAKHAAAEAQFCHADHRIDLAIKEIHRMRGLLDQVWETLKLMA